MLLPRFIAGMFSAGLMVLGAGVASGQDYPNKPIRIVTTPPGGGSDIVARIVAQGISGPLGQQVVVDNRASGIVAGDFVSKSPPDGYILLVWANAFVVGPLLLQKVPYDPVRDFSPVILAAQTPNILVVHPSLPVKSVQELIALAKARPGELNYSAGSTGGTTHLAAELFKSMAGVDMVNIPYKSTAMETADLIGGYVQLTFATGASVAPLIKAGRLRAVAVTSAQPSTLFPGLPTVAASGLPGFESVTFLGLWAAARTPAPIINRLNQETARFVNTQEAKERFTSSGLEAVGSTPEQFAATIKSEVAKMGKVIKDAGIKVQ